MLPSFFSLFVCDILLPICYMSLYTQNLSWHSNLYNLLEYLSDNVGPNVSTVIERAP